MKIMKKNKMMRAASVLLVAVLLTTSIISGTFAKYVTQGSKSESARVAKFGVVVTANGSLFSETYFEKSQTNGNKPSDKSADTTPFTELSVESNSEDNVVAPGTKSDDDGLGISVTGTPEVDVNVKFTVGEIEDIFLAKNTDDELPDMTTAEVDTFNNTTDYYPIKYTLTGNIIKTTTGLTTNDTYGTIDTSAGTAVGNLNQIKAVLNAINGTSGIFVDANTNLATAIGSLKLTWEWDFDDSNAGTYDKQDTLLGDLAAGTQLTPAVDPQLEDGTDYNLETKFNLTVSVTQID